MVTATTSLLVNRTSGLFTDVDGDGQIDPGDTLVHTITLVNGIDRDALNVVVSDTVAGSTLSGSVNVSPIAFDDSYNAVGNTLLLAGGASGSGPALVASGKLTDNDLEFFGDSLSIVTVTNAVSAHGGTYTINSDGSFSYVPAAGFIGDDTFTYTVRDNGLDGVGGTADDLTSTATVTITVSDQVWYVDSAAAAGGDGTSSNPFNSIATLNAADVDGPGDYIHVRGNAAGQIVLAQGQKLFGEGVALVVGGHTLTSAGTRSTITGSSGHTVELAGESNGNNEISGINVVATGPGNAGIYGAQFGTLTVNNAAIDASGQALSLADGAVAGSGFVSTDSDGGANNVSLLNISGTLNLGAGALSGASNSAVSISGGVASIDYNGSIAHTANAIALTVANKTGGTVQFDGAISSTGSSDGIALSANTGATINFTGALTLNTSASNSAAFSVTGGGTVTATGAGSTINSGSGTAITIQNTTIGSSGVKFETVNTSGAVNAIVLTNTGASGGLGITGAGSAGTGGTITGSTGDALSLTSTGNLALAWLNINNTNGHGINASNLVGANTINGVSFSDWDLGATGTKDGLRVVNANANLTSLIVTNSTFDGVSTGSFSRDGIYMEAQGASAMKLRVESSTLRNLGGNGIEVATSTTSSGTLDVRIIGNTFQSSLGVGGASVLLDPAGAAGEKYRALVSGNTISGSKVAAIRVDSVSRGEADFTIENNIVSSPANDGIVAAANAGSMDVKLSANTISGLVSTGARAIDVTYSNNVSLGTVASGDAIVLGNTIGSGGVVWTTGLGLAQAIRLWALSSSVVKALIANNQVTANTDVGVDVVEVRAGDSANLNLTATGNSLGNTSILSSNLTIVAAGTAPLITANVTGNSVVGGTITLREATGGVLNLVQASSPAVSSANGGANVEIVGTPQFGFAPPALPSDPALPASFLTAFAPPVQLAGSETYADVVLQDDAPKGLHVPAPDGVLSQSLLDGMVEAAIARWAAAGASEAHLAAMRAVSFMVEDLGGLALGQSQPGTITLDDDGAGWRWFIDPTPDDDAEFAEVQGSDALAATSGGAAAGRIDLLTTIIHELGHQIGLTDLHGGGEAGQLMFGAIHAGERRLPGAEELESASGVAVAGAFALSPVNIGTIPAGQTVTIQFRSIVDAVSNKVLSSIIQTTTVTGDNITIDDASDLSDTLNLDSLSVGNLVFRDADGNGVFNAGDNGIDGIALTLFADDGTTAGAFDAGDTQLATTTTSGGGFYNFANLAPGTYIVRVDASNFNSGPIVGAIATTGGSDPDDNIDNDSNAGTVSAGSFALPISLAYNSEPINGSGNDTNNTLDFGFIVPNQSPVHSVPGTQTFDEDNSLTFSLANGNAITIADVDAGDGDLVTTVSITSGVLTVGSVMAGLAVSGEGASSITLTGTLAEINDALDGLTYAPPADFNGSLVLTIETDDQGNTGADGAKSDSDTVTLSITPVNDAPVAGDDSLTVAFNGSGNLMLGDNDSDPDGQDLKFTLTLAPAFGAVVLDPLTGSATYTPTSGYSGSDSFRYRASDGTLLSNEAVVSVTVNPPNTAPVLDTGKSPALADQLEDSGAPAGQVGTLISALVDLDPPAGGINNVIDPDGPGLGIAITAAATANGSWHFSTDNGLNWSALGGVSADSARLLLADASTRIYFQPNANYNGTQPDAITFRAWDGLIGSNGGTADTSSSGGSSPFSALADTAALTITAVNDAPVQTAPAAQTIDEDTTLTFSAANGNLISIADIDAGTNDLTTIISIADGALSVGTVPAGLTVSGEGASSLTLTGTVGEINDALDGLVYKPATDFHGSRTLSIQTSDNGNTGQGLALSDSDDVTINIAAVNDAPVVANAIPDQTSLEEEPWSYTFDENTFSDVDSASLAYTATLADNGPLPAWLAFNPATRTFSGMPPVNFFGAVELKVSASDGLLQVADSFRLTIIDVPENFPPDAVDDVLTAQRGATTVFTSEQLLGNDSDFEGNPLRIIDVFGAINAKVEGNDDGSITFTPLPSVDQASFRYTVADSFGGSGSATVTVNLSGPAQSNAPVAPATGSVWTIAQFASRPVEIGASDPDGDIASYAIKVGAGPAKGSVSFAGDTFVYSPASGAVGADAFTIRITDAGGRFVDQAVTVAIVPLPGASDWRLLADEGQMATLGGNGQAFGTSGFQQITLADAPGMIVFDASFNQGGDVVRLPGVAAGWLGVVSGSSLILSDGDTFAQMPVGPAGIAVAFDDGARVLRLDTASASIKLGAQTFVAATAPVAAPAQSVALPDNSDPGARGLLLMETGGSVILRGDMEVFGTSGAERVMLLGGTVRFDGSFNGGGDTIALPGEASGFTARTTGSALLLEKSGLAAQIPFGPNSTSLAFADATHPLFFDGNVSVFIGNQSIGGAAAALAFA